MGPRSCSRRFGGGRLCNGSLQTPVVTNDNRAPAWSQAGARGWVPVSASSTRTAESRPGQSGVVEGKWTRDVRADQPVMMSAPLTLTEMAASAAGAGPLMTWPVDAS